MTKASEIMKRDVITVTEDEDVWEAIRIMVLNNITGLPVVNDDGTVVGILTERDVIRHISNLKQGAQTPEKDDVVEIVY